ncbi:MULTISPECIES: Ohr family peroxiredoxin [Gordonia]|uniref:Organic hydroperoxide resistance protein n=2 Tax=Gordonia TaxID=2053 RepID=L7LMA2_9ACTN|nr:MULTISPECIES: Ohr family peroxiredoxin [Gordonia]AUH67717.1 organic hydroperoxide resistance protein [Gordonia sp. YC-JH1]KJR09414.1 organic hydroperoxide resistance protein [Gordonia sihwensis]KXT58194.1 organic hydroperoxide resistance protein [Gordonia sp. QH-12]MBY4568850.1 organic hydroperoxide resistance protein [Gordonia sihwensis]WFN92604.1 Ohr family peroxiredoxin [Gordonia sihwensis]
MTVTPVYHVSSTSTGGGRDSEVVSESGRIDLVLAPPVEMGGNGEGSNPEELFSAGYAACFMGALRHVAKSKGATLTDATSVKVNIGIGSDDADGGFGLTADIEVYLPGLDTAEAAELAQAAHAFCPYSKATRGNIASTVTSRV